ncbi:MAG: hypothetical protein ACK4K3_11475 [Aquabacterium sp.]|jgi:hypothetical protein
MQLNPTHDRLAGEAWRLGYGGIRMLNMLPVIIRDVAKLFVGIDALCLGATDPDVAQECHYSKRKLSASLQADRDGAPTQTDWESVRAWVKAQLSNKVDVYVVISDSELQE